MQCVVAVLVGCLLLFFVLLTLTLSVHFGHFRSFRCGKGFVVVFAFFQFVSVVCFAANSSGVVLWSCGCCSCCCDFSCVLQKCILNTENQNQK